MIQEPSPPSQHLFFSSARLHSLIALYTEEPAALQDSKRACAE